MIISSSDASTARGSSSSSSSSSSKLDQKKLNYLKKRKPGFENNRVKKFKKTLQEIVIHNPSEQATDNTRMSQQSRRCGLVDMNSVAMHQAIEVQSKLPPEFPCFAKYMLRSHVSGCFWLRLPKSFCDKHLPKQDETFLLVSTSSECAEEHIHMVKYLFEKNGLSGSGGWKGFSVHNKLVEGDVLVFHLIESLKFKVYIVRANQRAEIDGAAMDNEGDDGDEMITDKCLIPCTNGTGNGLNSEQQIQVVDELRSENVEVIRDVLEFKDVKGFNGFNVLLDGLIIDREIPTHIRYKYYELCRNQKSFLHLDLVKLGVSCKLAAGIIHETVNISDAIKSAKVMTVSLDHLQSWDKTLKAFEDMGMRVGFLRACINKIHEQQGIIRSKKLERSQLQVEITDLKTQLLERRQVKKTLDVEIEALMVKDSRVEVAW